MLGTKSIALWDGPLHLLRWADESFWDRIPRSCLGAPLAEISTPEVSQGFAAVFTELMDRAWTEGRPVWRILDLPDGQRGRYYAAPRYEGRRLVGVATAWTVLTAPLLDPLEVEDRAEVA